MLMLFVVGLATSFTAVVSEWKRELNERGPQNTNSADSIEQCLQAFDDGDWPQRSFVRAFQESFHLDLVKSCLREGGRFFLFSPGIEQMMETVSTNVVSDLHELMARLQWKAKELKYIGLCLPQVLQCPESDELVSTLGWHFIAHHQLKFKIILRLTSPHDRIHIRVKTDSDFDWMCKNTWVLQAPYWPHCCLQEMRDLGNPLFKSASAGFPSLSSRYTKYINKVQIQNVRTAQTSQRNVLVLGLNLFAHDSTMVATWNGEMLAVVELERFYKERYYSLQEHILYKFPPSPGEQRDEKTLRLNKAFDALVAPVLKHLCEVVVHVSQGVASLSELGSKIKNGLDHCELLYDIVVLADPSRMGNDIVPILFGRIHGETTMITDHHHAHAASAWLDSPFYHNFEGREHHTSLVFSYDGYGNDGTIRAFVARPGNFTLTPIGTKKGGFSYGFTYSLTSTFARDFAWGSPYGSKVPCWTRHARDLRCLESMSGSFMAYAGLGKLRNEWRDGARLFASRGLWDKNLWPSPHGGTCVLKTVVRDLRRYFRCNGTDEQESRRLDQDFAATFQEEFENAVVNEVEQKLRLVQPERPTSLVMAGGCALSVKTNSKLARKLGIAIHVPPAPHDGGLALGGAWLAHPPEPAHGEHYPRVQFGGAPLTQQGQVLNADQLQQLAKRWGATELPSMDHLADILVDGAIVGVARGRSEYGPRALGHRSLLATAHLTEQKGRLNRLKHRQWYRPCAPIVRSEDLNLVFEAGTDILSSSPYMSFAPPLQNWTQKWLPAISHLDNTARPQGVRKRDDYWMHTLLSKVRARMSNVYVRLCERHGCDADNMPIPVGLLINTSFNGKNQPIIGDALDALLMFCSGHGEELDYVLLEERWLFDRHSAVARGLCLDRPQTT